MNLTYDAKTLEDRVKAAKRFINQELTQHRLGTAAGLNRNELGYLKDTLHEAERVGLRKLSDTHYIKVQRLLTSVEARMKLPRN
jgi:hypothetical protein